MHKYPQTLVRSLVLAGCALVGIAGAAAGQLPPEAVDLGAVKIAEQQKAEDLCPVHLVPSIADGETWSHDGVSYRGSEPGSKAAFLTEPAKYSAAHERQRWINNFMTAMSSIWCPITDEVTPGGRKQIDAHGYTWESCCSFCDDEMYPENLDDALERLASRAEEAYDLTGGVYVNDAKSPVEGAISEDY